MTWTHQALGWLADMLGWLQDEYTRGWRVKHDDAVTFGRRSAAAPYILQNRRVRAVWAKNTTGVVAEDAAAGSSPVLIKARPVTLFPV